MSYNLIMKLYEWNEAKNTLLKQARNVSFEAVLVAIRDGRLLADREHPSRDTYAHQRILIVDIEHYAYIVPYVEKDDQTVFLKTIIPSRVETRNYLRGDKQ